MDKKFWRATAERAAKTFCQSFLAAVGAGAVDVFSVGWKQALLVASAAAILSVGSSIGSSKVGESGTPSLVVNEKG
jgi:hypothetical protein